MAKKPRKTDVESVEKIAFVISPIGDPDSDIRRRADQILKHVIEPAVLECGYKALRADKISEPGIITSQIIAHILNDALLVADLTGHNPNVFYELAVRHAIKKPVVQLIQKGEKIPFDISTTRTIQLDHRDLDSVDEAKRELNKQIRAVEKDPTKVDSPISIAVDLQFLKQSEDPQRKAIAELRAMMQQVIVMMSELGEKLPSTIRESQIFRVPVLESSGWLRPMEPLSHDELNRIVKKLEEWESRQAQKEKSQKKDG